MKIAILGSRGIPAHYGGFETLADEVSTRLVKRGHEVTVYCCKPYSTTTAKTYAGVERVVLPAFRAKHLEKPLYAFLSLLHVCPRTLDAVLMLGVSVSAFCFIPRLFGKKMAINVDGLEWRRKKWGRVAAWYLRFSEKASGVTADAVVTDARWIRDYYRECYGVDSVFIAYGTDTDISPPGAALSRYGLTERGYILYVSRFEPENNALLVREAFEKIAHPGKRLVMVGDAPFAKEYVRKVRNTDNPNIVFTGSLYGASYRELLSHAYCYVQATEVGGTHPSLVEAMGTGNCVLANDVPEHREVLGGAGIYYRGKEELTEKLIMLMSDEKLVEERRGVAAGLAKAEYSWERVTDEYEKLFRRLVGK